MRLLIMIILLFLSYVPLKCQNFKKAIYSLDSIYLSYDGFYKNIETIILEKSILEIVDKNFDSYIDTAKQILEYPSPAVAFLINEQAFIYLNIFEVGTKYMIPTNYKVVDTIPLTVSSKLDREKLKSENKMKALQLFNESLVIRKLLTTNYKENLSIKEDLANNHYRIGVMLAKSKKYNEAIEHFKDALTISKQTYNNDRHLYCLHKIGHLYLQTKDLFEAKKWLEKARDWDPSINKDFWYCLDMGITYRKIKKYKLAEKYLTWAVQHNDNTQVWEAFQELGDTYHDQKKYNLALSQYEIAINGSLNSSDSIKVLNSIGMTYMELEEFKAAEDHFARMCELSRRINFRNLADLYLKQGRYSESIQCIQKAINQTTDQKEPDNCMNPAFNQLSENPTSLLLDYRIKGKIFYQWYQQSNDTLYLECAFNAFGVFNQLMDKMQQEFRNENTELFWLNEFYSTIETGLEVASKKYQQSGNDTDFQFILSLIEQNKANILLENLKRNNALDSTKEIRIPSIQEIKDNLISENSALLNFFVGNDKIYVVCISASTQNVYQFPAKELNRLTKNILEIISNGTGESDEIQAFINNSSQIYTNYLSDIINDLSPTIDELIVIPDGPLCYLPFDLLLKECVSNRVWSPNMPYLLKDYAITYGYSASLLIQHQSKPNDTKEILDIIGFAPDFNKYSRLENREELEYINKHFSVAQYKGSNASKDNFLKRFQHADILHLATHAKANFNNSDSSFIVFSSDNLVYLNEIYTQSSNASMVVLSACETGVGKLQRGEGVFSLARAFTNAGIPSATMSAWCVADSPTVQLMDFYYNYLGKGYPKHKALQKAKLTLWETAECIIEYHPKYWAAFVHYGDPKPITSKSWLNWWGIILVVIWPLMGFIFLGKRFFDV